MNTFYRGMLAAAFAAISGLVHADGKCPMLPEIGQVMATDARSRTTETYASERELHDFALFSYRNTANDILNGYGLYLDTITAAFGGACSSADQTHRWLRVLLAQSSLPTDFARRLAVAHALVAEPPVD